MFLLVCVMSLLKVTVSSSPSSSDMLIIRHGRSRVRHSTEKNHIRWGLKAFDNLTLVDYEYDGQSGTNNSNDLLLFDMGTVAGSANQSLYETSVVGAETTDMSNVKGFTTAPTSPNRSPIINWTQAPSFTSFTSRKKLGKKQIMESIRKNVDAGLEYLKSHSHLSAPTVSMPDLRPILRHRPKVSADQARPNRVAVKKTGTSLSPSITSKKIISSAFPTDYVDEHMQADDSFAAIPFPKDQNHRMPSTTVPPSISTVLPGQPTIGDKHNLNGNGLNTNHLANWRKLSTTVRTVSATKPNAILLANNKTNKNSNQPFDDYKTQTGPFPSQPFIDSTGHVVNGSANTPKSPTLFLSNENGQLPMNGEEAPTDDGFHFGYGNGSRETSFNSESELPFSPSGLYSSAEVNEEGDPNDDQTINFDLTDELGDTIPGPHQIEYIDLDDLDEISRNNRLKMKKGSDVLTKFLQIVESQHLLGANCTAGTALNLGEGVVDQYAQERFQTTAEVAVNRANMLTR